MDGYSLQHEDRVITIFSAPNYCYRYLMIYLYNWIDAEIRQRLWRSMTSKNSLSKTKLFLLSVSIQYDPAPRDGEPKVVKRAPDYFL